MKPLAGASSGRIGLPSRGIEIVVGIRRKTALDRAKGRNVGVIRSRETGFVRLPPEKGGPDA